MANHPSIEELLALNPHIDKENLEKAREVLRKLRANRTKKSGYNLASPLTRRPISTGEADGVDSRTIRLGRFQR